MAAGRFLPLACRRIIAALSQPSAPSSRGIFFPSPATAGLRSLQTIIEASSNASDERHHDPEDHKTDTLPQPASVPAAAESSFMVRDASSLKISPRHDMAMIFTCKVCETRSVKMASRDSYDNGVVVARCGGCNNLHLMADRLGWFGQPGSIEDFLAAQGQDVKKGDTDTFSFTLEDLAGSQVKSKEPSGEN
ncbi:DNL-type zinc finger protein [Hordeum vulgare subsp. vulgare]|uniref:DNL-type domain-containing protein n=1 Tax=Hordeum vulgare subsp. vulgare TaxID=112509 RepID=A0A8I6YZA2_HORVV|nr:DNL-type zinc finger protein [Hordeum vulgare subsp. vulgare]